MESPWIETRGLPAEVFSAVRERTIFDFCKWDPQVEDVSTLADFPLVLTSAAWQTVAGLAEKLAHETLAAEEELLRRPQLHKKLGLPRAVRRVLKHAAAFGPPRGAARVMRFDFHLTSDGWWISEVNSDVPGGFIEASGFTELVARHYPDTLTTGNVAELYVDAVAGAAVEGGTVGLVHATAYTDDRQQMIYLAKQLAVRGLRACLVGPDRLVWRDGRARIESQWAREPAAILMRFFPAEWLPNLPRGCGWKNFFRGGRTPMSNPASALLTQSKRFPLVWNDLSTPLPTWRALLPETRDPRHAPWRNSDAWVLKPALGRVGEGVGIPGVTPGKELKKIVRAARWHPGFWVAQRRFESLTVSRNGTNLFPCLGVFTVSGRVAGIYGRISHSALTNYRAQDIAVLVSKQKSASAQLAA